VPNSGTLFSITLANVLQLRLIPTYLSIMIHHQTIFVLKFFVDFIISIFCEAITYAGIFHDSNQLIS